MSDVLLTSDMQVDENPFKSAPPIPIATVAACLQHKLEQQRAANPERGRPASDVSPFNKLKQRRHMSDDGPVPSVAWAPINCDHITSVKPWWNRAMGRIDGYAFCRAAGGPEDYWPFDDFRIVQALGSELSGEHDIRRVSWLLWWHKPNGKAEIISLFDLEHDNDYWWECDTNTYPMEGEMEEQSAVAENESELTKHFGPKAEKPTYKGHTIDPTEIRYAIPKHMSRELELDKLAIGKSVLQCFGGTLPDYLKHHTAEQAWDLTESFVGAEKLARGFDEKGSQKPAGDAATTPPGTPVPETPQKGPQKPAGETIAETQGNTSEGVSSSKTEGQTLPESGNGKVAGKIDPEHFEPSPLLNEVKTLGGIPVGKIPSVLNRKHHKAYYKEIKGKKKDEKWTDLDPIAVRKRFDKVFGPHGFGWRLVEIPGVTRVTDTPIMDKYASGDPRPMHSVSIECMAFEYALIVNGQIQYARTSPFSDNHTNDDAGDAYRGALTSVMKQALKMLGGYDHFMDKALAS